MAWRDETLEQMLKSRTQPAPPAPKPTDEAEEDGGTPNFSKPYRACGLPRSRPLRSLFIYFNAQERRNYDKDRDFDQVDGPIITSIVIEPVEEEEEVEQPQRARG